MKRYQILPSIVNTILTNQRAWLVGSAAAYIAGIRDLQPNDFDVIIHPDDWIKVMRVIRDFEPYTRFNHFGGLKIFVDNYAIDVWPSTLDDFARSSRTFVACAFLPTIVIVRGGNP